LSDKVWGLTEKGQTALGPALVVSVALASQKPGSQVILCTDGLANIGLGNLDVSPPTSTNNTEDDTQMDVVEQWYEQMANWALEKGVVVNVISITDSECKLENLGKVCDITQGKVQRINPTQLTANFKGILEKKVLATKVQATMLLHPILRFKRDDEEEELQPRQRQQQQQQPQQPQQQRGKEEEENQKEKNKATEQLSAIIEEPEESESVLRNENSSQAVALEISKEKDKIMEEKKLEIEISRQVQDIGNVFQDSKIYFEYIIRKDFLQQRKEYNELKNVIFQVQIHYVRMDGAKMMRVITQKKPITRNKEEVLSHLNMDVIAANASRKSARLCEEGDYETARTNIYTNALWMNRNSTNELHARTTTGYVRTNLALDSKMQQQQEEEMVSNTKYLSKSAKKKSRSRMRGDVFSSHMYSNKQL